jgi:hypothetical protein
MSTDISESISPHLLLAICFYIGSLLGLFSNPEVGDDMFHRNIGWLLTLYDSRSILSYVHHQDRLKAHQTASKNRCLKYFQIYTLVFYHKNLIAYLLYESL